MSTSSFTAPLLALALAAATTGCATVSRPVEPAQAEAAPQELVGKRVRFVDAADHPRELLVESVQHPILRGTAQGRERQSGARYVTAPRQVTEEVDLRTVRDLVVLEPTGELSDGGEIALAVVEGILKGFVMFGLGLLVLL